MPSTFDIEYFKNCLRTTWIGSEFIHFKKVDSTNSQGKKIPTEELVHGTVIHTDNQYSGRGQYERDWFSEPGKNLTFTVVYKPPTAGRLTLLTMASAYAVLDVIKKNTDHPVSLKWPNDIMVNGKKVGGVLTECIFFGQNPNRVLIGIGLNLSKTGFNNEIKDSAISLSEVSGQEFIREQLLADLLISLELAYQKWHKQDPSLHQEISKNMIGYGEWVKLKVANNLKEGRYKFLGVNQNGELLVLNEDLDVNTFSHEQVRIITDSHRV